MPKENTKKLTIRKIAFNSHGDKFVSLNADGCLFIHAFDLSDDY